MLAEIIYMQIMLTEISSSCKLYLHEYHLPANYTYMNVICIHIIFTGISSACILYLQESHLHADKWDVHADMFLA